MRLDVLHVPDCPNLAPLLERLAEVTELPVVTRTIETADAAQYGMTGNASGGTAGLRSYGPASRTG